MSVENMRSKTSKPRSNYYKDFRSILHVKYSLIEKRLLIPLHKICMKEYIQLVKESQILAEKFKTLDNKDENQVNEIQYEIEKMYIQKEELFQALVDSEAISDE